MGTTRKSIVRPTIAIAPAEHPATTVPRGWASASAAAQRRLAEHAGEVAGMAAREIDEVRLADRLERCRVVALG